MKFLPLHLFHKVEFGSIEGYDDIKYLLKRALSTDENYNLLFCGPPASAKTLFLLGILECTTASTKKGRGSSQVLGGCQVDFNYESSATPLLERP
jgi:hypothetical protein